MKPESRRSLFSLILMLILQVSIAQTVHTWEMHEIVLRAEKTYNNYYAEVISWVDLKGPGFEKRIYGFWDGDNIFKVRVVAIAPGRWEWMSGSNQPADSGLNGKKGEFTAEDWSKSEIEQNPNRKGFVRSTANGHALQYADGSPFFLVGDTWLAGTTWRLPFRNATSPENYEPAPGIGFEDAVAWRKRQGFNSVSMIASFPTWFADSNPNTYADKNGIYIRNAWEKFGYPVNEKEVTGKDMRDESGNMPFEMSSEHPGVADFERIIPAYFRSLDKKMQYLSDMGFVPLLETVRRDICPAWKTYSKDFNESYSRYVQYLISRYGAYNILFSGIHLDWIPKQYSLTGDEFNEALTYHLKKYGPLPFGQPHTTLINSSTLETFGHADKVPWLTMHSVGNNPRDHRVSDMLLAQFNLVPAYPTINFEPYYTGWDHSLNKPHGERPAADSDRDNYFSRAMMYVSVLSGGLSGHVHGTAAYDITSTGEPAGFRPHIWVALKYRSGWYMRLLNDFILSEGLKYQDLKPVHSDISIRKATGSFDDGLDGWSYMMRDDSKKLAMLYFENKAVLPELSGFLPGRTYTLHWFNPETGEWIEPVSLKSGRKGTLAIPSFPDSQNPVSRDWALKILLTE